MTVSTPTLPTKQKAAVYNSPGSVSIEIVEADIPEPGPDEVLINLTHSGVCHSDLAIMTNSWTGLPPAPVGQVGGHEGVGRVVKLGSGTASSGIKIGDRVGVKWVASACGNCEPCQMQLDSLCFNQKVSGFYTPGTFQQYVLGPANYVTRIPDAVESAQVAPLLCAGLTVYSALKRSLTAPGQWVVISGAGGGLGHLAVQIASKGMGFRVIGVDHGTKADLVKDSGAEHFVDITKFPADDDGAAISNHIKALTGGLGAHTAIVCTAANSAYSQAVQFLRFSGTLVCVGIPSGESKPIASAYPGVLIAKQLKIIGSAVGNRVDAVELLEFAARGIVKVHLQMVPMEELAQVFQDMKTGNLLGRAVIDLS
ncbi:Polyketide synthase enoylreductase [Penicillium concentricum]|uniref:Polyketide synthase enoylreductase n=1 Tax=Penicillium concentricum TaxID=293559 RepID=A0A9W9V7J5_9EURO|nr:Polyketide synthase enoylreductase [Penicillium concentricum]KAJ5371828.1 Polyketide synthase enoylreductase [Penicillium concentricum]